MEVQDARKAPSVRPLAWSLWTSAGINLLMILTSVVGSNSKLGRISDAIFAPPGAIADHFIVMKEHSAGAFFSAALTAFAISFVFYALVSWAILQGIVQFMEWRGRAG